MPDLAAAKVGAVVQLPIDYDARPDAGADGDIDEIADIAGQIGQHGPQGGCPDVQLDLDRNAQSGLERLLQGHVFPVQIWREERCPCRFRLRRGRPRRRRPLAASGPWQNRAAVAPPPLPLPRPGLRRSPLGCFKAGRLAGAIDQCPGDLRPANVKPYGPLHGCFLIKESTLLAVVAGRLVAAHVCSLQATRGETADYADTRIRMYLIICVHPRLSAAQSHYLPWW